MIDRGPHRTPPCRRPRRQPHPLRPAVQGVRRGLQPGHADLVTRYGLAGERLGEVVAGAVIKHSRDFNLTREVVLGSSLAPTTSAYDIQQACGTGLQAAILVANKIALGQIDSGIAGGVDTASDAPITVTESLRKKLLKVNRAKGGKAQALALTKIRPTDFGISTPANVEPRTGLSMGDHMAITAKKWGITREAQDELAELYDRLRDPR